MVSRAISVRERSSTRPQDGRRTRAAENTFLSNRERVPALDGLRGLALVAVLIYHAAPAALPGGFLGVEMFFVLSGFLLTALLLGERYRTGVVDAIGYARRRIRRIFPALIVLLSVLAVVGKLVAPEDVHRLPKDILASFAGIVNWHFITDGSSYFAQTGRPPLVRHLWSIAIELQAYIILPVVAIFVARWRRYQAIALLVCGIGVSAATMALLYEAPDPFRAYYGTDARIGALLTGALVAVLVTRRDDVRGPRVTGKGMAILGATSALCIAVLFAVANETSAALYPAGFLATQIATATLIVASMRTGFIARGLREPILRWLGRRSYGIYLWHWPIVVLLRPGVDVDLPRPVTAGISIALALFLGSLSFRIVEKPFLLEKRWARRPLPHPVRVTGVAWAAAMLALITLLGRTTPVDPIAESLLAGERALAEQEAASPVPVITAPLPTTAPRSGSAPAAVAKPAANAAPAQQPGRLPAAKGPPKGSVKLSAIGDSVMLGASPKMKDRFGGSAHIDAVKNRRFREAAAITKQLRKDGKLGRVHVVHLGNNGPAKAEEIDAMMNEAKPASHVLLVTVRVNKPWEGAVNQALRDAAKRHKKVKIVDWNKASGGHPEWFYSDGTHVNSHGAHAYTQLIAGSVPPPPKEPKPKPKPTPKPTPTPGLLDDIPVD